MGEVYKVYRERLEHLIEVLRSVPEEQFDMRFWSCGTSACVVGWACLDEQFNDEGLHFSDLAIPCFREPGLGKERFVGWAAVEEFFGLSHQATEELFQAYSYLPGRETKPSEVVARIEKYLANRDVE